LNGSHGVRGNAKIKIFADDPSLIDGVKALYIDPDPKSERTMHVTLKNCHKGDVWLCKIDGIETPEAIKALGRVSFYIDDDALPDNQTPDEDGYYYHQLEGLEVYQDENGSKGAFIGKVQSVQNFGGGDLLDITRASGEAFFHSFDRQFTPVVNLEEGYITIIDVEVI
jgi:16S rRNA processing protein RimM